MIVIKEIKKIPIIKEKQLVVPCKLNHKEFCHFPLG
ncbi:hypothetical protein cce_2811 [Crocosphaera subtropica ATCC 51142]|uniref:Uncharacterized protein n=1 Tax=Crocosphaera subtropica (strain ATCC 51142 / BH68) TaxID=43989 RepID=B1WU97_CROS5|nr:hypothetical protein cce_2811 [Crocosphaera subtropica ATCC 51142]